MDIVKDNVKYFDKDNVIDFKDFVIFFNINIDNFIDNDFDKDIVKDINNKIDLKDIKKVISHPQAISQCLDYINKKAFGLINGIFESEYYKKMLKGLKSKELREYIKERNEAFKKKKLKEFLKKAQPARELTAGIIYYGD